MPGDRRLQWQSKIGPHLAPAGWLYGRVQAARRWAYHKGLFSSVRIDRPVISVGSLVSGGTGKTPLVAHLARRWRAYRVAVLSRGYGGSYRGQLQVTAGTSARLAGDEPVLLARSTGADVWVARNRALLALRLSPQYDVFLLDDGYQHLGLERFLNICTLPDTPPGDLLPAGLWRECPGALRAADLVVANNRWPGWIDRYYHGPRVVIEFAQTAWCGTAGSTLPRVPLFAFCGVAGPDRFVGSLAGLDLRGSITWPDHHAYQAADLAEIEAQARRAGALALVTTAKDAARLDEGGFSLPLYFCDLDVRVVSGAEEFDLFVDSWFAAKM